MRIKLCRGVLFGYVNMIFHCFSQVRDLQMGVDLGREYVLMSQQLLHLADVGTALQKVCGEGVSQRVRAYSLLDAGTRSGLADDGEDHHARKFRPSIVKKNDILAALFLFARLHVELYAVASYTAYRHHTLLVAFARHADETLAKEEIADLQLAQFAYAQTAGVEQLQNRLIAKPFGGGVVDDVYQSVDLGRGEYVGQRTTRLGCGDKFGRRTLDLLLQKQIVEKTFHSAQCAGL